jgi:DNA-directed RNA polymerase specialized sigma24 family protein
LAIRSLCDEDFPLLERIQHGDERAIALLYDRYSSRVYSVALRVLRDPALAEQILSDIFIDLWGSRKLNIPIGGSFGPSIAMVARNRAAALLHRQPAPDRDFEYPSALAGNRNLDMTLAEATAAIDRLPVERRIMMERAFFQGMNQSEFAGQAQNQREKDERQAMGSRAVSQLAGTGLEVIDLESDASFARRQLHDRDVVSHIEGMNRLARVFVESPANILRELAKAAVELCGADSSGISIEQKDGPDDNYYHWVATAGQYSGFVDAKLPRYPSACGVTLERGRPQIFRVSQRFFDLMGVQAPTVTDGLLLPWQAEETRGTIWIMAHGRDEAFDGEDCRMMQALANFAATGVRLEQQQKLLIERAKTAAAAAMAHKLAHQINNPLQGLMQTVFLFGRGDPEHGVFAQQALGEAQKLSELVKRLLSSPEQI